MRRQVRWMRAAACLSLVAVLAASGALADHVPTPAPPALEFVGIEAEYGTFNVPPGVVSGYVHVFNVRSQGGPDWVTGHSGNGYKLWRRIDSEGESTFSEVTFGLVGTQQSVYQIRVPISPAEFEWTSTFHATEVGGISWQQETAPSTTVQVTTPMPAVILDTRFGASSAAGFRDAAGRSYSASNLAELLAADPSPTIRMVVFGFNLAFPDFGWSVDPAKIPAGYPGPRIRWNGELGLVSGERRWEFGAGIEFDVPRELLRNADGVATIEVVQGSAQAASSPYQLTVPLSGAPRNLVAVADATGSQSKRRKAPVRLTWDPPTTPPPRYAVERRRKVPPSADASKRDAGRAVESWVEVALVDGDTTQYIDKTADVDETYPWEYRVASVLADARDVSASDEAQSPGGRAPRPYVPCWTGAWDAQVVGVPESVSMDAVSFALTHGEDYDIRGALSNAASRGTVIRKAKTKLGFRNSTSARPVWADYADLADGSKGTVTLTMQDSPPFDPATYASATGEIRLLGRAHALSMQRTSLRDDYTPVHATVGVALPIGSNGKRKTVADPGDRLVIVLQFLPLERPLLAGCTNLQVQVRGGRVLGVVPVVTSDHFREVDASSAGDSLELAVGALGPNAKGRVGVATLVLGVEVTAPDPSASPSAQRQMSCAFSFSAQTDRTDGITQRVLIEYQREREDSDGETFIDTETTPTRLVEVAVAPPAAGPANR